MNYDPTIRLLARAFMAGQVGSLRAATLDWLGEQLGDVAVHPAATNSANQGVAVVAEAGGWVVALAGTDIFLERRPIQDGPRLLPFADFIEKAATVVAGLMQRRGVNAIRLAVIQEGFLPAMEIPRMDATARRLLNTPQLLSNPWEWDWKSVTSIARPFGNHTEDISHIATIKRLAGMMNDEPFDRIRVDLDLNTPPSIAAPRFTPEDAAAFIRASAGWHAELEQAVAPFLRGETDAVH